MPPKTAAQQSTLSSKNVAFFELSGSWLSLYPWSALAEDAELAATGEGSRGVTLAHNVASKSEVDEVMAQAEKAGATMMNKRLTRKMN